MDVVLFKPKSQALKERIDFFYLLTHHASEAPTKYIAFPKDCTILSVINNAKFTRNKNECLIQSDFSNPFASFLITPFQRPFYLEYQGAIKELTIVFKPLGINYFLTQPLSNYILSVDKFMPFNDFENVVRSILKEEDDHDLIHKVESYLLSKLYDWQHPFLLIALRMIAADLNQPLSQVAQTLGVSHKTLIHHFNLHLNISPSAFRKIQRFRKVLGINAERTQKTNLTAIAHEASFYDQAHMINQFRSLTGESPKRLFDTISSLEDGALKWKFQ